MKLNTRNINFTEDELNFIETVMDVSTSIGIKQIHELTELYLALNIKKADKDTIKLIANQLVELQESYLITKSIRNKLENRRHG